MSVKRLSGKRPSERLSVVAVVALVGSVLWVTWTVVVLSQHVFGGVLEPVNDTKEISASTRFNFPKGSVLVAGQKRDGLNSCIMAQVRFRRSELASFLKQPFFDSNFLLEGKSALRGVENIFYSDSIFPQTGLKHFSVRQSLVISRGLIPGSEKVDQVSAIIDLDNPHTVNFYVYYLW